MTEAEATRFLAHAAGMLLGATEILDPEQARTAFRAAARHHHPDAGGDPDVFRRLVEARDLLAP
jgi:curved DNA-binding protein CbpA